MLGERDIIERFFNVASGSRADVHIGIGDDAAVLAAATDELAVAVDAIVAGVHFPQDTPPRAIGHRVLAVNLSDLAATGAQPAWATLALTLERVDEDWLAEFAAGFFALARRYRVALVGGDTVRGPLQAVVQIMGHVPAGQALRRAGASAGDDLYVSGTLGDAAAGLRQFGADDADDYLAARFLYPTPRVELGLALRDFASAAIDVSDGLALDLSRLARASGCGARVDIDALPLSTPLRAGFSPAECRRFALGGGDDYELCFAVPAVRRTAFNEWCAGQDTLVTRIGVLTSDPALTWLRGGEPGPLELDGYDHFAA